MNDNVQKITYVINFNAGNKTIYTSKCDFELQNRKIDFNKCPIVAEISAATIRPVWNVQSFDSVDIDVSLLGNLIPASLKNPAMKCATCKLKHLER